MDFAFQSAAGCAARRTAKQAHFDPEMLSKATVAVFLKDGTCVHSQFC
jgi:hypothetical protein